MTTAPVTPRSPDSVGVARSVEPKRSAVISSSADTRRHHVSDAQHSGSTPSGRWRLSGSGATPVGARQNRPWPSPSRLPSARPNGSRLRPAWTTPPAWRPHGRSRTTKPALCGDSGQIAEKQSPVHLSCRNSTRATADSAYRLDGEYGRTSGAYCDRIFTDVVWAAASERSDYPPIRLRCCSPNSLQIHKFLGGRLCRMTIRAFGRRTAAYHGQNVRMLAPIWDSCRNQCSARVRSVNRLKVSLGRR